MVLKSVCLSFGLALAMGLAACASMTDTPNQKIQVVTPGATESRCVLATQNFRVVAYPPQPIFMRRMQDPLTVTCQAAGDREKTVVVYASLNGSGVGNIATAGLGGVYDQVSGALYEYPERIVVDFTNTLAKNPDLPGYHARDTVSPHDQINENMQDRPAETPHEQGLKNAPSKRAKSTISKEDPPLKGGPVEIERPY